MIRISVPFSSKWAAKLCRNVWTVTRFDRPVAATAERQAACKTVCSIGLYVLMVGHGLTPGVKHGDDADLGAQSLRVCGDRLQRLGCNPHRSA
jgi:hypothetical protein